jgi:DNA replication and repair protein RecF
MTLLSFSCTDFRCLQSAELELAPRYNLAYGANASGKTSLLEAIAWLGRGHSFRGAPPDRLVRHGAAEFLLFGRVRNRGHEARLGVRHGRSGLEISVDGDRSGSRAELIRALPLQIADPEIHSLVAGGPEQRRRYLDWIAFHVEPGFLDAWRRFRRALKQRNAALKEPGEAAALAGWDREFTAAADQLHDMRRRCLDIALPVLAATAERLLGGGVGFEYQQGWPANRTLAETLAGGRGRDLQQGTTHAGPQRADLTLSYDERRARKLVSRGQQKLLACAMILAATEVAQTSLERPLLLLLDDPAAELDQDSLERLMGAVAGLGCQVIATALQAETLFVETPRTFHVEQGILTRVS